MSVHGGSFERCSVCFPLLQMQKDQLLQRPPHDLAHLHLRERGYVGDPALGPLGCQSHARSPAQRDHPGGRQQRRRSEQAADFMRSV